jgi:hypothetical protein
LSLKTIRSKLSGVKGDFVRWVMGNFRALPAAGLSTYTAQALVTSRYPLQSLTRRICSLSCELVESLAYSISLRQAQTDIFSSLAKASATCALNRWLKPTAINIVYKKVAVYCRPIYGTDTKHTIGFSLT